MGRKPYKDKKNLKPPKTYIKYFEKILLNKRYVYPYLEKTQTIFYSKIILYQENILLILELNFM